MKKLMLSLMLGGLVLALSSNDVSAQAQRVSPAKDVLVKKRVASSSSDNVSQNNNSVVAVSKIKENTTDIPKGTKVGALRATTPSAKAVAQNKPFEELYAGEKVFMEDLKQKNPDVYREYLSYRETTKLAQLSNEEKQKAITSFKTIRGLK